MADQSRRIIFILGLSFVLVSVTNGLFWTVFRVFIYDIGGTFTEVALVSAVQNLSTIILSPFWGALSDEIGRRKPFIVFGSLSTVFFVPFFIAVNTIVEYLIVFAFASISLSIITPTVTAYLSDISEKEYRGRAMGYFFIFSSAGWTIGGLISGFIAEIYGMDFVFVFSGVIGVIGALFMQIFIREERSRSSADLKTSIEAAWTRVGSTLKGAFTIGKERQLGILLLVILSFGFGSGIFFTLLQIKIFESLSRNYALYGIFNGASGLMSILAPPIYGYFADRFDRRKVLQYTLICYSMYFVILGIVWDPLILGILWAIPLWPGVRISSLALAADISKDKTIGEYQGFVNSSSAISQLIGALIGGIIADLYNARVNFSIIDIILIFSAIGPLFGSIITSKIKKST